MQLKCTSLSIFVPRDDVVILFPLNRKVMWMKSFFRMDEPDPGLGQRVCILGNQEADY